MQKLTPEKCTIVMQESGISGDWHGKLDPHEAGYIHGTLNPFLRKIEGMINNDASPETVTKSLVDAYHNEATRIGEMHELMAKAIAELARQVDVEDAFMQGLKQLTTPTEQGPEAPPSWQRMMADRQWKMKHGIADRGGD